MRKKDGFILLMAELVYGKQPKKPLYPSQVTKCNFYGASLYNQYDKFFPYI